MPQTTSTPSSTHKFKFAISLITVLALAVSCGDSKPNSPISAFQPEVTNSIDSFQFQATAVENVSDTLIYTWQNTGQQATINHSSAIDSGAVSVTILDASGAQVYGNPLVASLNEPTAVGVAGSWTITVTLLNISGSINFTAQKL